MLDINNYIEKPKKREHVSAIYIPYCELDTPEWDDIVKSIKAFVEPDCVIDTIPLARHNGLEPHISIQFSGGGRYVPFGTYLVRFSNNFVNYMEKDVFERTYNICDKVKEISW